MTRPARPASKVRTWPVVEGTSTIKKHSSFSRTWNKLSVFGEETLSQDNVDKAITE